MSDQISEIHNMLAANTAAQTGMAHDIAWIRERVTAGDARVDIHEKRLTSLERWRSWTAGIVAAIGALIGYAGTHAVKP